MLPAGVCMCPALKKLHLRKNFVMKIPAEFGILTSLEDFDISENNLQHVSPEIRNLTGILTLNLAKNELEYLPPLIGMTDSVFGNLGKMQTLDLSNNRLVFLPLDLRMCSSLTDLHVYGNFFKHPAMVRAQIPCFGSLKVTVEQVSNIVYLNKSNQPARNAGNPICSVGLEGGKSATAEQTQETTCKNETDNPRYNQTFPLIVRDCYKVRILKSPSS